MQLLYACSPQVPLLITLLSMVAKAAAKFVEDKVSFSNADKTRTAFVPPSPAKFNRCYVIYNTRIPKVCIISAVP